MQFHRNPRPGRPRHTSLAKLAAYLGQQAKTGLTLPLYPLGGGGDDASRILHLEWDGTRARSVGPLRLSRLTPTQRGTIASGSGTTYALEAGHSLPASGTARVWDTSAGTEAGADVTYTVSGNNLTLGAARTMAAGDYVFALQGGYVTEFDIGSAKDVRPSANVAPSVSAAGLRLASIGTARGYARIFNLGNALGIASPDKLNLSADVTIEASAEPGANSELSLGFQDSTNSKGGRVGLINLAGTWSNRWAVGAAGSGSGYNGTGRGTWPGASFGMPLGLHYVDILRGAGGAAVSYFLSAPFNLGASNAPYSTGGGSEGTPGWGASAAMDHLLLEVYAATNDLAVTLKELEIVWPSKTAGT